MTGVAWCCASPKQGEEFVRQLLPKLFAPLREMLQGFSGSRAAPVDCSTQAPGVEARASIDDADAAERAVMRRCAHRARHDRWLRSPRCALARDCRRSTKPVDCRKRRRSMARTSAAAASGRPSEWWKRYQDPTLDRLIEHGARQIHRRLATAHARFDPRASRCGSRRAASGAHVKRQRRCSIASGLSDNGIFPPQLLGFTWYNQSDLGLQASYTFDWWGKQRDAVEAAMDQAHAAQADRSAAALMLASSDCRYVILAGNPIKTAWRWRARTRAPSSREAQDHCRARARGVGLRGRYATAPTSRWLRRASRSPRSRARRSCVSSRWRRWLGRVRRANCRR